ncbi:MAG: hypothetical protein ACLPJW_18380 [Rhodomicrobium sp.]
MLTLMSPASIPDVMARLDVKANWTLDSASRRKHSSVAIISAPAVLQADITTQSASSFNWATPEEVRVKALDSHAIRALLGSRALLVGMKRTSKTRSGGCS